MRSTQRLAKNNLLLVFDAFGTLFRPRAPIAVQYGEVARQYGIDGFTQQTLNDSFRAAFKHEAKENSNYGKSTGLGAEQWWKNVMSRTFSPFLKPGQEIPQKVYSDLLTRFSTDKGYTIYPDVLPFFEMLRRVKRQPNHRDTWRWDQTMVGVITNSDDRVIGVLESLGLNVAHRNAGNEVRTSPDIDFVVLSYDVGVEKPHPQMFEAARRSLEEISQRSIDDFDKLHVGDDFHKDYLGAKSAGWNALFLDRKGLFTERLPENTSIASVDLEDSKENGNRDGKIDVIQNLDALRNWVPR